jgi:hypothetical protein
MLAGTASEVRGVGRPCAHKTNTPSAQHSWTMRRPSSQPSPTPFPKRQQGRRGQSAPPRRLGPAPQPLVIQTFHRANPPLCSGRGLARASASGPPPPAQTFQPGARTLRPGAQMLSPGAKMLSPGAPMLHRGAQIRRRGAPMLCLSAQMPCRSAQRLHPGAQMLSHNAHLWPPTPFTPPQRTPPSPSVVIGRLRPHPTPGEPTRRRSRRAHARPEQTRTEKDGPDGNARPPPPLSHDGRPTYFRPNSPPRFARREDGRPLCSATVSEAGGEMGPTLREMRYASGGMGSASGKMG